MKYYKINYNEHCRLRKLFIGKVSKICWRRYFFFYTCIIELKIKKFPVPVHDVDNNASEYKTQ